MMTKVLQRPTLVLNRSWQPIHVATVARALTMLWNQTAHVADPTSYELYDWKDWSKLVPGHDELFVQSVRQRLRVPEVITLTRFDRIPTTSVTFSRRNIFRRDRFTCQYCNRQPGGDELTIDHVVPRAQGGLSSWTNCVLACTDCNRRKADRTPVQANMQLENQPVRPTWKPVYSERTPQRQTWAKFFRYSIGNSDL